MSMSVKLPELPYSYDALTKSISEETMLTHHTKHHQGYVDKLNIALEKLGTVGDDLVSILTNLDDIPAELRLAVRNNGGGHFNHSLFWQIMSPDGGGQPRGELAGLIEAKYGSFQGFVDKFTASALGLFGSGWVWLTPEGEILTTPNQDNPIMIGGLAPIMGLDVWEHAYYLDYKNQRDRYTKSWWDVVNWIEVEKRYQFAIIS